MAVIGVRAEAGQQQRGQRKADHQEAQQSRLAVLAMLQPKPHAGLSIHPFGPIGKFINLK